MRKSWINEVIKDFPVRHPEQRNIVTNITVADTGAERSSINAQVHDQ